MKGLLVNNHFRTQKPLIQPWSLQNCICFLTGVIERTSTSSGFISMRSSSQSYNYSSSKSSSVTVTEAKQQSVSVTTTSSISSSSSIQKTNRTTIEISSPPALPVKQRSRRERHPSQYDNVPSENNVGSGSPTRPPPLPLKKKHSK